MHSKKSLNGFLKICHAIGRSFSSYLNIKANRVQQFIKQPQQVVEAMCLVRIVSACRYITARLPPPGKGCGYTPSRLARGEAVRILAIMANTWYRKSAQVVDGALMKEAVTALERLVSCLFPKHDTIAL